MSPFGEGTFGSFMFGGSGGGGTDPGPVQITGWGGVRLWIEVDFSRATEGIGNGADPYSALWGTAIWGEDRWPAGTSWTDVAPWGRGLSTRRAFSEETNTYNAGTLTLTLDNTDGRFSPDNPLSPYRIGNSTSIGVLRPIRVRAEYAGIEWSLFSGRVETWDETYQGRRSVIEVTAVDAFADLGAFDGYEQTPQGAGDTYLERINRILDNARFRGGRRIDVGEHTFQATTLAQNALSDLKLVEASEGGAIWVGGDGILYADGRDALLEKERSTDVQVVFSNHDNDSTVLYEPDVQVPFDGSHVVNVAAYARAGGTVQIRTSEKSRTLYRHDRQDERSDLIAETDEQVDRLARRTIALRKEAERRVESLKFIPHLQPNAARKDVAWQAVARGLLGLRNLVEFRRTADAGFELDKYLFVNGMHHTIDPTRWAIDVDFASATVWHGAGDTRWGSAVWGESRYPI